MKTILFALLALTGLAAAPLPVRLFVLHPILVTDESKDADFVEKYLKKWAKSEITFVDAAEKADITVEILKSETQKGAGTARTSRGVFGGLETHRADVYLTTAKVCLTKTPDACTEIMKESQNLPDAIKKFVKDNAKTIGN